MSINNHGVVSLKERHYYQRPRPQKVHPVHQYPVIIPVNRDKVLVQVSASSQATSPLPNPRTIQIQIQLMPRKNITNFIFIFFILSFFSTNSTPSSINILCIYKKCIFFQAKKEGSMKNTKQSYFGKIEL